MKTLVTLGLLTLLCFLTHSSAGPIGPQLVSGGSCCEKHSNTTIPRNKVIGLQETPRHCKLHSLIVTTKKKKVCLDFSSSASKTLLNYWKGKATVL